MSETTISSTHITPTVLYERRRREHLQVILIMDSSDAPVSPTASACARSLTCRSLTVRVHSKYLVWKISVFSKEVADGWKGLLFVYLPQLRLSPILQASHLSLAMILNIIKYDILFVCPTLVPWRHTPRACTSFSPNVRPKLWSNACPSGMRDPRKMRTHRCTPRSVSYLA